MSHLFLEDIRGVWGSIGRGDWGSVNIAGHSGVALDVGVRVSTNNGVWGSICGDWGSIGSGVGSSIGRIWAGVDDTTESSGDTGQENESELFKG